MLFRQLFDHDTSTYTYLLADPGTRAALIIDPVKDQSARDLQQLKDLDLRLELALDTHVHADHISGLGTLRAATGCRIGLAAASGARCADLALQDGDELRLGALAVKVLATPGHTNGCVSYLVGDRVFTGDALLIRGCGRTDFQDGDPSRLYDSVTEKLFRLPDSTLVYPGHDYKGLTVSTIGEEKRLNPRLTQPRAAFVHLMQTLNLPQPKRIAEAVPANLRCGDV